MVGAPGNAISGNVTPEQGQREKSDDFHLLRREEAIAASATKFDENSMLLGRSASWQSKTEYAEPDELADQMEEEW